MARNSRVLLRQLLGDRVNPCAPHYPHHHKHPCSFVRTLASIPSTPSSPLPAISSTSKTFDSSPEKKPEFNFRNYTTYFGPPNIPVFTLHNRYDEYLNALKKIQGESLPAIILFITASEHTSSYISDCFADVCEPFPHVAAYEFLLDPKEDDYKSILKKLNIPSTPTFHFYQNGKKVAEITRKRRITVAYINRLKKTLIKLYISTQPTKRLYRKVGKEKRRVTQDLDKKAKKDKDAIFLNSEGASWVTRYALELRGKCPCGHCSGWRN